ncbi:HutD family protein [Asticcacaulis sp. 201]|uniref:HutD/Ves family protein n=1 Tax=Asticcacaulis sp. 201 TaxID=3028787 RepID=UPI0029164F63|nr:HutD family protein [Asticcacaulis sp. 201]MDV6330318.1 HutD family protein [Asticcacaulis sp. 201]
MIRHLTAAGRVAVPWKNGGGVTREIAVFPEGANMDEFLWRVSMADVTEAGPFSRFDGIDRHLTVLAGRLQLDLSDNRRTLQAGDSLAFDGSTPVHGTPLLPVTDLNVMTRRGTFRASVDRILEGRTEGATLLIGTTVTAVHMNGQVFALEPFDALLCDGAHDFTADNALWRVALSAI